MNMLVELSLMLGCRGCELLLRFGMWSLELH